MLRRVIIPLVRQIAAIPSRFAKPDFLAVFNYHQVSPTFEPKCQLRSTWTPLRQFEAQLGKIKSHFRLLRLPDAIQQLKEGMLKGPCAAITLDDGDISLERYVTPLLQKHGIPATYFINSGYWGDRRTFWVYLYTYLMHHEDETKRLALNDELKQRFALLRSTEDPALYRTVREQVEAQVDLVNEEDRFVVTKDFLKILDPDLFSIGLHGHEHQRFSMMPEDWQRQCIEMNIEHLADLPCYCPIFAIPFGRPHDWDDTVIRICRERRLGVVFADGGINMPGDTQYQRMPADGSNAMDTFRESLVGW